MEEKKFVNESLNRKKVIVRTSLLGIFVNIILSAGKALVGVFTKSIAVILDAVNNLSDALSSLVTIIGTKLGARLPNKKHPLGFGRIEYLSALVVSAIVIYAGMTSLVESIKKIIHPEKAEYSFVSLIIIGVAVFVKLILGLFVRSKGKKVKSTALTASGVDAMFDAILSSSVLISAVIYMFTGFSLEAYVGVVISGFIIKSGVELMIETVNDILGQRADAETVKKVKALIREEEGVRGAYDLIINNYGPEKNYASVHVEVPDTMTVDQLDQLTRKLEAKVYLNTGIVLTAVGVYSYNTQDDSAIEIREKVNSIVKENEWAMQVHGFYVDQKSKYMRMDVVVSFSIRGGEAAQIITRQLKEAFPDYAILVTPDVDVSAL